MCSSFDSDVDNFFFSCLFPLERRRSIDRSMWLEVSACSWEEPMLCWVQRGTCTHLIGDLFPLDSEPQCWTHLFFFFVSSSEGEKETDSVLFLVSSNKCRCLSSFESFELADDSSTRLTWIVDVCVCFWSLILQTVKRIELSFGTRRQPNEVCSEVERPTCRGERDNRLRLSYLLSRLINVDVDLRFIPWSGALVRERAKRGKKKGSNTSI